MEAVSVAAVVLAYEVVVACAWEVLASNVPIEMRPALAAVEVEAASVEEAYEVLQIQRKKKC